MIRTTLLVSLGILSFGRLPIVSRTVAAGERTVAAEDRATTTGKRPPNIVLIIADDLGRECLGCYGGQSYPTPNIDALARRGVRYRCCYATPMCSPSRVMLLTGRRSDHNYVQWARWNQTDATIASVLAGAGYRTAMSGKWHLGGWPRPEQDAPAPSSGATESSSPVSRGIGPEIAGFERYATFDYETVVRESGIVGNQYWNTEVWIDGQRTRPDMRYAPELFRDYTLDFLDRAVGAAEPFFVYHSMVLAHRPFVPTPATLATTEQRIAKKGDVDHFPAMVSKIDDIVGDIVRRLEELGVADDTIVVFTSDNGTDNVHEAKTLRSRFLDRWVAGEKYLPSELGAAVPLIVAGPGVIPNAVMDSPVDFTDLLPTLGQIGHAKVPTNLDGESLWSQWQGGPTGHDGIASTWGVFEKTSRRYKDPRRFAKDFVFVVRDKSFRWQSDGQLFDVTSDPLGQRSLSPGQHPDVRRRMRLHLDRDRENAVW